MKTKYSSLFALISALFLAACSTSLPLKNINDKPVPDRLDGSVQTEKSVKNGIVAGCVDKGWTCREVSPGLIAASITVRKHRANTNISYDSDSYSITYKDSHLLDYSNTIHRNYNRWITYLDDAIAKRLML